jgi:hypothetical protein
LEVEQQKLATELFISKLRKRKQPRKRITKLKLFE